jgi:hypothetical protein
MKKLYRDKSILISTQDVFDFWNYRLLEIKKLNLDLSYDAGN